LTPEVK